MWDFTEQEQRTEALRVINAELSQALVEASRLQGILPICSYCRRIRSEEQSWHRPEEYLAANAPVQFSHGICPTCFEHEVRPQLE